MARAKQPDIVRDIVPRILTRAERRRVVRNAVVREILDTAATLTTDEAKNAGFDRARRALEDADDDERQVLMIRVMEALNFGRE